MKATLSSLYTLLPLTCYRRSTPFDSRQCEMAWITERNLSKAALVLLVNSFCEKVPFDQMLRKRFWRGGEGGGYLLPHVNGGHSKLDSFQPQNHEEPLAKGTVAHILTVMSSLKKTRVIDTFSHGQTHVLFQQMKQWQYLVHSLHDKQVIWVGRGVSQSEIVASGIFHSE